MYDKPDQFNTAEHPVTVADGASNQRSRPDPLAESLRKPERVAASKSPETKNKTGGQMEWTFLATLFSFSRNLDEKLAGSHGASLHRASCRIRTREWE